jgi:predicted O-methyltransferase YrrM
MNYTFPKHFKYPTTERVYFQDHIALWEEKLSFLKNKPNVCLEIGALFGAASTYILDNFCKLEGSHLHIMDLNTNEFIQNNIAPYSNVTYHQGLSEDLLRNFSYNGLTKQFLDFVYIDGNHMSKYVLEDAVNSFYYLKPGGVMVFDDYGWGESQPAKCQPKTGIDAFLHGYHAYFDLLNLGWHVILKRNDYDMTEDEKESNYYVNWNF